MFGANYIMPRHYFPFFGPVCYQSASRSINSARNQSLGDSSKDVRAKADLRFRKAERAATARDQAMNEYAAESERRRLKTAKLKELRLAKEAEEQATAAASAPPPKKKPAAKVPKASKTRQAGDVQASEEIGVRSSFACSSSAGHAGAHLFGFLPGLVEIVRLLDLRSERRRRLGSHLFLFRFADFACCCVADLWPWLTPIARS